MANNTTARVYVGTYAKYNSGSIAGKWLDLENYADHDDFMAACAKLHADEDDPEFMFQDYKGFPRGFYGESYIDPDLWEWLDLDDHDRELLAVYQDHVDENGTIDQARDAFAGRADSPEDWAAEWLEETGEIAEIPERLRGYFDYAAYARDCSFNGMTFARHEGDVWVFHPC